MVRFGPYGTHRELAARKSSLRARVLSVLLPERDGLSLKKLKKHPHGIDLGPLERAFPQWIFTPNRKIAVAPELYLKDVERAREKLAQTEAGGMLLIGRRHVRSNNSWMHNSHRLVKGKPRCTAMLHPQDAERLGIANGQIVSVSTRVGSIELPAEITDSLMPGVISVPHGWGHDREGVRLEVARKVAGVSINDITDERHVDAITAMPVLNGVPVTVVAVDAAPAAHPAAELAD
jgi:anaerobic selenocysteine-containing dehydrogenase